MNLTGHIIDTVSIQIDKRTAKAAIEQQLRDYAAQATEAAELFSRDAHKAAYSKFPWHSPVAKNLEEFCSVFAP